MNFDSPLESVKSDIAIEFENQKQAKIIYDAIVLEFETAPDYRSSMNLTLDESRILIRINAEDSTSFRASVNSAIKWIKLSFYIRSITSRTNMIFFHVFFDHFYRSFCFSSVSCTEPTCNTHFFCSCHLNSLHIKINM